MSTGMLGGVVDDTGGDCVSGAVQPASVTATRRITNTRNGTPECLNMVRVPRLIIGLLLIHVFLIVVAVDTATDHPISSMKSSKENDDLISSKKESSQW